MAARVTSFIIHELAPFPGRAEALARYMASLAVIMLVMLAFDIPMLSLAIIMIFFASKENTALTAIAGRSMAIGMSVVLLTNLALMPLYIEYPLSRVIMLCLFTFSGMYLYRACRSGSVWYIISIYIGVAMNNYEVTRDAEILTRQEMYLWSVSLSAVAATVLINLAVMPAWPKRMVYMEIKRQLAAVMDQIEARIKGDKPPVLSMTEVERGMLAARRHLNAAATVMPSMRKDREHHLARIETVERLYLSAVQLSRMPPTPVIEDFKSSMHALKAACAALSAAVRRQSDFFLYKEPVFPLTHHQALAAELQEMAEALYSLATSEAAKNKTASAAYAKPAFFVPDAFTNPVYPRFAFKAMLATLTCYLFYMITQWPGIHTCMTTCLILALPGLGAVSQKAILRISGTIIGSIMSLLAAVFIVPYLENVTGFLLLSMAVAAIGGWIGTGSARSNYAGLQIVYAYSMSLCEFYYPSSDLMEIRDRLIGIMVGIVVSTVVYSLLWPEKDSVNLPKLLVRMMHSLSALVRVLGSESLPAEKQRLVASARANCWSTLASCREMQARVVLEPGWRYSRGDFTPFSRRLLMQAQKMMLEAGHLQALFSASEAESPEAAKTGAGIFKQCAELLNQYAEMIENGREIEISLIPPDLAALEKACAWAPSGSACRELPKAAHSFIDLLIRMKPGIQFLQKQN